MLELRSPSGMHLDKRLFFIFADVTETLLVEVDQIYHLACPASPIFYKYNPVKVNCKFYGYLHYMIQHPIFELNRLSFLSVV
jgi:hypothetical protein